MQDQQQKEEIIDIEEYSKSEKTVPKGKKYHIRIDKTLYTVSVESMLGKELLELANKLPVKQYGLYQKLHGGITKRIEYENTVDFTAPGVERFVTLPLDQIDGRGSLRRMFDLPESDLEHLSVIQINWETVKENNVNRIVIYDYPVPEGYNLSKVNLNLRIEASYPDSQIDMVYFYPPLVRNDNIPIKAIANDSFDNKIWQRWSRHRTGRNPWRPGIDNITTHLFLVDEWLKKELCKS